MSNKGILAVFLIVLIYGGATTFMGYQEGKGTADRWWQAHRGVQAIPVTCKEKIVTADDCKPVDAKQEYHCPEWDTSCGFKPADINTQEKQIEDNIQQIKKGLELRDEQQKWEMDAIRLMGDCANVDEATFTSRKCAQRKAAWQKQGKKF